MSASLDPSWCYPYTRFTNQQLQLLFELLNLPPHLVIHNGKCHSSSEEAFIITWVLATGLVTVVFLGRKMTNESPTSITTPSGG